MWVGKGIFWIFLLFSDQKIYVSHYLQEFAEAIGFSREKKVKGDGETGKGRQQNKVLGTLKGRGG